MLSSLRSDLGLNSNAQVNDGYVLRNRAMSLKCLHQLNKKGIQMRGHALSPQGKAHAPFVTHSTKSLHSLLKHANMIKENLKLFSSRNKTEQFGLMFKDINKLAPKGFNV